AGEAAAGAAGLRPARLVLAEDPDEQEDQHPDHEREDECRRPRDADRPHPEPEEEEENQRPDERLDAVIDRRRAQVHRANSTNPASPAVRRCRTARRPRNENERASRRRPFHSPTRSRFRPPHPLTFGFRLLPSGGAST